VCDWYGFPAVTYRGAASGGRCRVGWAGWVPIVKAVGWEVLPFRAGERVAQEEDNNGEEAEGPMKGRVA
jgi:hypothetical protein